MTTSQRKTVDDSKIQTTTAQVEKTLRRVNSCRASRGRVSLADLYHDDEEDDTPSPIERPSVLPITRINIYPAVAMPKIIERVRVVTVEVQPKGTLIERFRQLFKECTAADIELLLKETKSIERENGISEPIVRAASAP